MRRAHAVLLSLAAMLCTTSQAAPTYRVERVPVNTARYDFFGVAGINNRGDVVGDFSSNPYSDGFIYRSDGLLQLFHPGIGYTVGSVSINDRRQVAVNAEIARNYYVQPFIYNNLDTRSINISPEVTTDKGGTVSALNNLGHAVGAFDGKPFFYDGTQSRYLELATNSDYVSLIGLNDHDVMAGYARWKDGTSRVFLSSEGRVNYLSGVDDYYDHNNAGQVLAIRGEDLVMVEGNQITRLANRFEFGAEDMNDRGWITGIMGNGTADAHAVLYRNGQFHNLNDLISPEDAQRWTLVSGIGLNNKGQITGYGSFDGESSIFIATPVPEPAAAALMLAGLGILGSVVRRHRIRNQQNTPEL